MKEHIPLGFQITWIIGNPLQFEIKIFFYRNGFSQKVAEEYLNLFDFINLSLINSMRKFFDHFVLVGETQERERVLAHFTHRYMECNPDSSEYFHSEGENL